MNKHWKQTRKNTSDGSSKKILNKTKNGINFPRLRETLNTSREPRNSFNGVKSTRGAHPIETHLSLNQTQHFKPSRELLPFRTAYFRIFLRTDFSLWVTHLCEEIITLPISPATLYIIRFKVQRASQKCTYFPCGTSTFWVISILKNNSLPTF